MVYDNKQNRFIFEILDFKDCYLKNINYEVIKQTESRDKIVYVNHKNICIRNNDKLVFGSLILQPTKEIDLSTFPFNINIHQRVALDYYNFRYFTLDFVYECIKLERTYFLFHLLNQFIREFAKSGKWSVKFSPAFTFEFLDITQKDFLGHNNYTSDLHFFETLKETIEAIIEEDKKERLQAVFERLEDLNSKSRSFDQPARIVYIHSRENQEREVSLRSDTIILAAISDHQDFLLSSFIKKKSPLDPPSWIEMKKFCVIYWYKEISKLRRFIDKSTMIAYKKNKNVFEVLFWFVLLGKSRLLVPLFKLEGGQERFMNFFSLDFREPKNRQKAVNNAFVLKSQKKFELCAAFFILAKKYLEAIEILIVYLKDMQLALLVYRIFENEINRDEKLKKDFHSLIKEWFIDKGENNHDYFLKAIGFSIFKDYEKMIEAVKEYNSIREIKYVSSLNEEATLFGFNLCNFSPYYKQTLNFISISSYFKRYDKPEENVNEQNYYIACFNYYVDNGRYYEALEAILKLKKEKEELFKDFINNNKKALDNLFTELTMKKFKSLIKKKTYWRLKEKLGKIKIWLDFFEVDFSSFITKIKHRVYLINNFELNLFFNSTYRSSVETQNEFNEIINDVLHKCKAFLKVDLLCYLSEYKYLKKLSHIKQLVEMFKNVFLIPQKKYQDLYSKQRNEFNDVIGLYIFLMMLRTQNWDCCLMMIDNYDSFDILEKGFKKQITAMQEWSSNYFTFIGKEKLLKLKEDQLIFSNSNLIITLFLQMQIFRAFANNRRFHNHAKLVNQHLSSSLTQFEALLEKDFLGMLGMHPKNQQIEILEELGEIFESDFAMLKNKNFLSLNPKEALNLDANKRITSIHIKSDMWKDYIQALRLEKVLELSLRDQSDDLKTNREAFFGSGIELFKIRNEQSIGFFNNNVITDISIFSDIKVPEVFVVVQGKIRKVNIFKALFKRSRINNGYNLAEVDDISSISVVNENLNPEDETAINKKPAFYRCLYKYLFKSKTTADNQYVKILESVLDLKGQKRDELNKITQMKNHSKLQILFVSILNRFLIVSAKTLATLCRFEHPDMKKIKFIITDHNGYKIVLIDHNKNAFVVKYNLGFKELYLIQTVKDKNIYHAAFFENSTKIVFSTYTNNLLVYDFLSSELKEIEIGENSIVKNKLLNFYKTNTIVCLNTKGSRVTTIDAHAFNIEETYEKSGNSITAFAPAYSKNLIVLGFSNGLVEIVDIRLMECVFSKTFEDEEGNKKGVDSISLLNGFVVVSFTNGVLSIVFKI